MLGNNVQITGTGMVSINMPGSAVAGSLATLGNLKIGANQELAVYDSTGTVQTAAFHSVTLSGSATFLAEKGGVWSHGSHRWKFGAGTNQRNHAVRASR